MGEKRKTSGWQQHFPTYSFKDNGIAIEEYHSAASTLEAGERLFLNAANISALLGAAFGSLVLGSLEKFLKMFAPTVPEIASLIAVLALTAGFGWITIRYFADRQKSVVFAARKVVVLRRMLEMKYGHLQLVLPNWRIEGADEPFVLRLFPGWNTYVMYPCYIIASITSTVSFFVSSMIIKDLTERGANWPTTNFYSAAAVAVVVFMLLCWVYRSALLDTHERPILLFGQVLAKILRVRMVGNFEYVIYRGRLSGYELDRLEVDLTSLRKSLVFIEDKSFFKHRGVSLKGLLRPAMYLLGKGPRSGGSTITQQLARSLFIKDVSKLIRRKLVEIVLSFWLDQVISKDEQLKIYLASVRFEKGVFGIVEAMKYFWGELKESPTSAECFFLVERVSNVKSRILVDKVCKTIRSAKSEGLLKSEHLDELIQLYEDAVNMGKIRNSSTSDIQELRANIQG